MNAYIASFMLLLFNAVGLAVPASAAAEERVMPELGGIASQADAAVASQFTLIESSVATLADHGFAVMAGVPNSPTDIVDPVSGDRPVRAAVAMRADSGDKLEHEEGAP